MQGFTCTAVSTQILLRSPISFQYGLQMELKLCVFVFDTEARTTPQCALRDLACVSLLVAPVENPQVLAKPCGGHDLHSIMRFPLREIAALICDSTEQPDHLTQIMPPSDSVLVCNNLDPQVWSACRSFGEPGSDIWRIARVCSDPCRSS